MDVEQSLTGGRPYPTTDAKVAAGQLTAAIQQVSDLIGGVTDPGAAAVGRWTAREVAAHIAAGLELYTSLAA
ncbi:MAG TPA: hypothetical protein VKB69_14370, partial [Micromonosporaceae bacterium]|nr:hypothetical protein [Micromonosporaceae bacterium]